MGIHEIKAAEVEEWSRRAAEHMLELRTASGALPLTSAGGFLHRTISKFRVGTPIGARIFVDDEAWQWLWICTDSKSSRHKGPFIVDVKIDEPGEEWIAAYRSVVGDAEAAFESFQGYDPFIDSLPRRDYSIDMMADLSHFQTNGALRSNIHLRHMSDSEVMRFMVAAANEKGKALADVTPGGSVNVLKRDAFRQLERTLSDGIATPGQLLYTIEDGHEPVGYAWMEIDSGTGRIHSVVTPGRDGEGYRRSAVAALAEIARLEGMRRIVSTVISPSHEMASVLEATGFIPVRRLSYILPSVESSADASQSKSEGSALPTPLRVEHTDLPEVEAQSEEPRGSEPKDRFDLMQELIREEPAAVRENGIRRPGAPSHLMEPMQPVRVELPSLSARTPDAAVPPPLSMPDPTFQQVLAHMTKRQVPVCA